VEPLKPWRIIRQITRYVNFWGSCSNPEERLTGAEIRALSAATAALREFERLQAGLLPLDELDHAPPASPAWRAWCACGVCGVCVALAEECGAPIARP